MNNTTSANTRSRENIESLTLLPEISMRSDMKSTKDLIHIDERSDATHHMNSDQKNQKEMKAHVVELERDREFQNQMDNALNAIKRHHGMRNAVNRKLSAIHISHDEEAGQQAQVSSFLAGQKMRQR